MDKALRKIGKPYSVGTEPPTANGDGRFDVQFDELDDLAKATFGSTDEAAVWLRSPHPMLEGQSPFECAKSGAGARRVKDMLVAIKHGGVA